MRRKLAKPRARTRPTEVAYPTTDFKNSVERMVSVADRPVRQAFIDRALRAVARLSEDVSDQSLARCLSAPNDLALVVRALQDPSAIGVLRRDDPLASARLRGIAVKQKFLEAEGGCLSAEEVAKALRLTRQAVDKRRGTGKLIALSLGRRGYAYPSWQFSSSGTWPGLESILADLRSFDPWMQLAFFLGDNDRLKGRRPLDLLRTGRIEDAKQAALAYGEHGAA